MSAVIYTVIKEFFVEVNGHAIKARIMSPINDDKIFVFKISSFYKSKTDADAYEPASTFTSYANAERHLLQYLEGFQNTLDLGGEIAPGNTFSYFLYRLSPGEVLIGLPPPQTLPHPFGFF